MARLRSSEQSLYTDPSSNLKSFWLYCKLFWGCSTSAPSVYQVSWISGCVLNNYWELISVVSYVSLIFHPVFLWYNSNRTMPLWKNTIKRLCVPVCLHDGLCILIFNVFFCNCEELCNNVLRNAVQQQQNKIIIHSIIMFDWTRM